LLSHVAGGGEVPGLLGILVPLVLATAVCVPLAGRRLSIIRVSASVIASQLLFHVLFVLGSTGNASAASATGGAGHAGHGGHGSAAAPLLLATPAAGPAAGVSAHAHAGMWAAHAAAAAVTILAIYQGERVVRRLRTLAVALVRVLLPVVATIPVPFRAAAPADIETVSLPRSLSVYPSTRSRRGPPAVSFPSLPLAT